MTPTTGKLLADRSLSRDVGPVLYSGSELAEVASNAIGSPIEFENISEYVSHNQQSCVGRPNRRHSRATRAEAKRVLASQSDSDESEKQYILEYYRLVREGKTNYIATTAFRDVTGTQPTGAEDFFKMYAQELRPRKKAKKNGA